MNAALLVARNRRLRRTNLACLAENPRMMRIARAAGARPAWSDGEIVGEIDLPPANPLSMVQEGLQLIGGLASHSLHGLRRRSIERVAKLGGAFVPEAA